MKFNGLFLGVSSLVGAAVADSVPFERLNINDTVILAVDHQVGLFNMVGDWDKTILKNNILGHAALGELFSIPVVLTTAFQQGANGPLMKEITEMYPNTPLIKRQGEINAWDNAEFRDAVKATGRKQIVIAGLLTEICTTVLALSLREEGYSVWANVEASGTTTELIRDTANARMKAHGVHMTSLFAIVADLVRDYRNPVVSANVSYAWTDQYLPAASFLSRQHVSSIQDGIIVPGQEVVV